MCGNDYLFFIFNILFYFSIYFNLDENMQLCFVTGSRAEYGYSIPLIQKLHDDPFFDLRLIVTGSHLSPEFGYTINDIKFPIAEKIECLLSSDTSIGISKAIGLAVIGFAEAYDRIKPDLIFVTGDRFETFAATVAAHVANIPIAHNGGGELTEGSQDDAWRHSITKMAHIHFVSTDIYGQRVIQLGENPERIFTVGALELEGLKGRKKRIKNKKICIILHPHSLTQQMWTEMRDGLLDWWGPTPIEYELIQGGYDIGWASANISDKEKFFLSRKDFHNSLLESDVIIGNSSAGLMDGPALGVPSVNIGDRQKGRLKASSVIDCEPTKEGIKAAFDKLYSKEFQESLKCIENPYKGGNVSGRIVKILKEVGKVEIQKPFYDSF